MNEQNNAHLPQSSSARDSHRRAHMHKCFCFIMIPAVVKTNKWCRLTMQLY